MSVETEDVVTLLKADHEKLESLFTRLDSTPDSGLVSFFHEVREELIRHEVAEELAVYPTFRREVPGGDAVADKRLAEQREVEKTLVRLQRHDDEPVVLRACLMQLRRDLLIHAKLEEQDVFPALQVHTKPKELKALTNRYRKALDSVPAPRGLNGFETLTSDTTDAPIAPVTDRRGEAVRSTA